MIKSRTIRVVDSCCGSGVAYPKYCDSCDRLYEAKENEVPCEVFYNKGVFVDRRKEEHLVWHTDMPKPDWLVDYCSICDICMRGHFLGKLISKKTIPTIP
jgi:methionyl-tRNA synthetase